MGELHLDIYMERMRREYNCEVIAGKPQVAYRETITQRARHQLHAQEADRRLRSVRADRAATSSRCPADAVETYEFVDDVVGGSIPREFIPACDKGFKEGVKKGTLIGFPVVGIRCAVNDGAVARGRLVRNGVQDGRAHGLPRGLRRRQARPSSSRS